MKKIQKNNFAISIAILVLCILTFACLQVAFRPAYAETSADVKIEVYETKKENDRLETLIKTHIDQNMGDLTISKVKSLTDFSGNRYTVFELLPTGYIVYHNDSGKFVEYSGSAKSPYFGFSGNLFYGGMGQFYRKENDQWIHTITGETLTDVDYFSESNRDLALRYNGVKNDKHLAYIKGKTNSADVKTEAQTQQLSASSARPAAKISMTAFFPALKYGYQFGYKGGGTCGYIAANMLIAYNYFAFDDGLTTNVELFNDANKTINGTNLTEGLMLINGISLEDIRNPNKNYPGTVASDFPKVIDAYLTLTTHKLYWNITSTIFEFGVVNSISDGYPVALFGNYTDPQDGSKGNHVVVAYKYEKYGFLNLGLRYQIHYGWPGYSDIWMEAVGTGSSLFMEVK